MRSESLSILCRRPSHEVIEQTHAEHIKDPSMSALGIVLELVLGIDDHGGTAPNYSATQHSLGLTRFLSSSLFSWASNMPFQASRYRSCQNKGRRTPFEYKVDKSNEGALTQGLVIVRGI